MLRKIEKNAKSKEEALELAAEEFGVSVDELSYKVEREVGKGLMGLILGKEVIISAWITKEAEEEDRRLAEIARKRADSDKLEKNEANPYAPKVQPHTHDYADVDKRKKSKSEAPAVVSKAEKAEAPVKNAEAVAPAPAKEMRKNREVTEKSLEDAKFFVTELVAKMQLSDVIVDVENGGDCVKINLSGPKMGLLIGKRGDTLDAIQYLTSLYVNKSKNSYIKVSIDTENYRSKREETLVKLAKSLERRVVRESNAVTLEPMSPNERRIIHAALQNSNSVKTYSVGDEPNRKVVVALK
ncbi:MAG: KH domain-containing protein [Clostridia bacterium]|nr:KH domain-containing protein [Clostridia bacterium]